MREKKKPKMARFIDFIIDWMIHSFVLLFIHSYNHSSIQQIFSECRVYVGIFLNTKESNIKKHTHKKQP